MPNRLFVEFYLYHVISAGQSLWYMYTCICYSMFCVGNGILIGSGAPECIFHNQHNTLFNLFSPDLAVSYVGDKQVSHREIYALCSIFAAFHLGVYHSFFSHGCIHMGQMDFISSIFSNIFFKIIWEAFH